MVDCGLSAEKKGIVHFNQLLELVSFLLKMKNKPYWQTFAL